MPAAAAPSPRRVLVVGATGYIGRHAVRELVHRGHSVLCLARRRAGIGGSMDEPAIRGALPGAELRFADVTDPASLAAALPPGERLDAVISCLATRTGGAVDAWRIEHDANLHVDSGLRYSIVRPTAFFKSLCGQVRAVARGKPFVVFGNGELTACKPIGEPDVARLLTDCLDDPSKHDAILPVGGPGPAITPREQGELLFQLCGRPPRFRHVPVRLFDAIVTTLGALSRVIPPLRDKAELAHIGRYYATESMLVWDDQAGRYDEAATPSFGEQTLREVYARVLREGLRGQELGDHAMF